MCLLTFWLLLRQALTEKEERQKDRQEDTQLSTISVRVDGKTPDCETPPAPPLLREALLSQIVSRTVSGRRRRPRRCRTRRCCSSTEWAEA